MKQLAKCMKIKLISHWFNKNKQNYYRNKVLGNIIWVPQTENKTDLHTALIRFISTALQMSTMNYCLYYSHHNFSKYTLRKLTKVPNLNSEFCLNETYSLKMNLSVLLQYFFVIVFFVILILLNILYYCMQVHSVSTEARRWCQHGK